MTCYLTGQEEKDCMLAVTFVQNDSTWLSFLQAQMGTSDTILFHEVYMSSELLPEPGMGTETLSGGRLSLVSNQKLKAHLSAT